jgi:hypothetical protein
VFPKNTFENIPALHRQILTARSPAIISQVSLAGGFIDASFFDASGR